MSADPAAALDALRLRFLARAAEDLATLRNQAESGEAALEEVRFLVHRLAGAAGVFGYAGLSDAAARLDAAFQDGADPGRPRIDAFIAELAAFVEKTR